MNNPIVPQSTPINPFSVAYGFGRRDAEMGMARQPEEVFASEQQQAEYAAGVASISVPVAKIVTPQLKRNVGREYVRRTDNDATAMLQLAERHANRITEMLAKTAAESPWAAGDILWA